MSALFRKKGEQFFDENGLPLPHGYFIYFSAGTNDPTTVYQDADLQTPHAEEVDLDASGVLPFPVYLASADVKEILYRADGSQVFSQDDYPGGASSSPVAGTVLQSRAASYATYSSHTDTIPNDNTVPVQADEGDQILSVSITPAKNTNVIRGVAFVQAFGATASNRTVVAVFRGSTCIAVGVVDSASLMSPIAVHFVDSPAATTAQTYSVRVGTNGTGTSYVNGNASNRLFGGAQKSTIEVWEVAA